MAPETSRSVLERLAFLRDFPAEYVERLTAIAVPVHWNADEFVFREGSRSDALHLVREGRVALELSIPARQRVTILTVGPGEVFGWSGLFGDRPKSASARAVVATEAYRFDAAQLRALCDADPCFGYTVTRRLLSTVADRLKGARMQLLDLFASPAHDDTQPGERH